ncbi:MAG: response regulator, partial [Rhizomicrobium sp.]
MEAGDGTEALRLLAVRRTDLVITNLNRRPMTGIALTKQLRRPNSSFNSLVPVLMISGHRDDASVRAAIDAKPRAQVRSTDYRGPDRRRTLWVRH